MASFTNITNGTVVLNDENGYAYEFTKGQTRTGLSNYFYTYCSALAGTANSVLKLNGSLDGAGVVPAPLVAEEDALQKPGAVAPYPHTQTTADMVLPDAVTNTTSPRRKMLVFDMGEAFRRVDAAFVGLRALAASTDVASFKVEVATRQDGIYHDNTNHMLFISSGNVIDRFAATESGVWV